MDDRTKNLMKDHRGAKLTRAVDQHTGESYEMYMVSPETFKEFVIRKLWERRGKKRSRR